MSRKLKYTTTTFVVVYTAIALWGGLALGATNKEASQLGLPINGFSFANFTDSPNNTAVGIEDLIPSPDQRLVFTPTKLDTACYQSQRDLELELPEHHQQVVSVTGWAQLLFEGDRNYVRGR